MREFVCNPTADAAASCCLLLPPAACCPLLLFLPVAPHCHGGGWLPRDCAAHVALPCVHQRQPQQGGPGLCTRGEGLWGWVGWGAGVRTGWGAGVRAGWGAGVRGGGVRARGRGGGGRTVVWGVEWCSSAQVGQCTRGEGVWGCVCVGGGCMDVTDVEVVVVVVMVGLPSNAESRQPTCVKSRHQPHHGPTSDISHTLTGSHLCIMCQSHSSHSRAIDRHTPCHHAADPDAFLTRGSRLPPSPSPDCR
jgi:hypothetical protein